MKPGALRVSLFVSPMSLGASCMSALNLIDESSTLRHESFSFMHESSGLIDDASVLVQADRQQEFSIGRCTWLPIRRRLVTRLTTAPA